MNRLVDVVVRRIGIDVGDRFSANARKVKFVINGLPEDSEFPVKFTDFQVNLNVPHSFCKVCSARGYIMGSIPLDHLS